MAHRVNFSSLDKRIMEITTFKASSHTDTHTQLTYKAALITLYIQVIMELFNLATKSEIEEFST